MEGAKTAPVDAAGSCHLAGTVYSCEILPLPAERHLRQQRDHLQRPAQIAEIMHLPPRPGLSDGAADPGVMHAVRARRQNLKPRARLQMLSYITYIDIAFTAIYTLIFRLCV